MGVAIRKKVEAKSNISEIKEKKPISMTKDQYVQTTSQRKFDTPQTKTCQQACSVTCSQTINTNFTGDWLSSRDSAILVDEYGR